MVETIKCVSPQILNRKLQSHFQMENLLRKSTPDDCAKWGYFFFTIFSLENDSAIRGSKSDVWDETQAIISTITGSYFSKDY